MRKNLLWIFLIALLILSVLSVLSMLGVNTITVSAGVYPAIYIEPSTIVNQSLTPGSIFSISIKTDYNGSDIQSWQFALSYNSSVLNGVEVTNGDLITTGKHPNATFMAGTFNNTVGKLSLTAAFFFFIEEPAPITSGPGTLANVTFTVLGTGASNITIGPETKLVGYDEGINPGTGETEPGWGDPYRIVYAEMEPEHIQHGYFTNFEQIHDVAVISLFAPDEAVVGDLVPVSVEVSNVGTVDETFEVTISYNLTVIDAQTINLTAGDNRTLHFDWNTTGVEPGTYDIEAEANLDGDVDQNNNKMSLEWSVKIVPEFPTGIPLMLVLAILAVFITILKRRKTVFKDADQQKKPGHAVYLQLAVR